MRTICLFIVAAAALLSTAATACPGDTNGDGAVNFLDLNTVLSTFNHAVPPGTGGDVTGDGLVGFADLNLVISSFNLTCVYDAQLVSIQRPDILYAGQAFTVAFIVRHNGDGPRDIPIEITVGAAFPVMQMLSAVPPNQNFAASFNYTAPAASAPCADGDPFHISARINYLFDPDGDTGNDSSTTQTTLAAAHWDLELEIINSPTIAEQCDTITWTVRIRNTGNIPSWPTCMRSGTNCFQGGAPGQWSCTMGTQLAFVYEMEPGAIQDIPFSMTLPCWALPMQQWIKAELALDTGCSEFCPPGNFAETPVQIVMPTP